MTRFSVTGFAPVLASKVQHIIRAKGQDAAKERFKAAHPDARSIFVKALA